jgi:hypothetical protein
MWIIFNLHWKNKQLDIEAYYIHLYSGILNAVFLVFDIQSTYLNHKMRAGEDQNSQLPCPVLLGYWW